MNYARALRDFIRMNDAQLENKALTVHAKMSGNPDFLYPVPAMDKVGAAIQVYTHALAVAKNRDKVKIAERKSARNALEVVLTQLVNYVNTTADGDRTKLLGTGFTVSAEQGSAIEMGGVSNAKVVQGSNSGEAVINCASVKGVKIYLYNWALAPLVDGNWNELQLGVCKTTISGLQRGKEYVFRIVAVNSAGKKSFSDVMNLLVV